MSTIVTTASLILAGSVISLSLGAIPLHSAIAEILWLGMAVSAVVMIAGSEASA